MPYEMLLWFLILPVLCSPRPRSDPHPKYIRVGQYVHHENATQIFHPSVLQFSVLCAYTHKHLQHRHWRKIRPPVLTEVRSKILEIWVILVCFLKNAFVFKIKHFATTTATDPDYNIDEINAIIESIHENGLINHSVSSSTMHCPTALKFGRLIRYEFPQAAECIISASDQIQGDGRRRKWKW